MGHTWPLGTAASVAFMAVKCTANTSLQSRKGTIKPHARAPANSHTSTVPSKQVDDLANVFRCAAGAAEAAKQLSTAGSACRAAPAALQVVKSASSLPDLVGVAVLCLCVRKHAALAQQELQHGLPAGRRTGVLAKALTMVLSSVASCSCLFLRRLAEQCRRNTRQGQRCNSRACCTQQLARTHVLHWLLGQALAPVVQAAKEVCDQRRLQRLGAEGAS